MRSKACNVMNGKAARQISKTTQVYVHVHITVSPCLQLPQGAHFCVAAVAAVALQDGKPRQCTFGSPSWRRNHRLAVARRHLIQRRLLHDAHEFVLANLAILILVKLVDHPSQLVVCELLAQVTCDTLQVSKRNLAALVFVEKLEGLPDLVHRVLGRIPLKHNFLEGVETDVPTIFAIISGHELKRFLLFDLEAHGSHSYLQLVVIHPSLLLGIKNVERLFDFLALLLGNRPSGLLLATTAAAAVVEWPSRRSERGSAVRSNDGRRLAVSVPRIRRHRFLPSSRRRTLQRHAAKSTSRDYARDNP
mmetsp:Transcript_119537/g.338309  ORF Transcript_119537/g.338309 Transcript_119537/m.338309 type:complete len:305 (+) Transcript_119537:30-944(+)